MVPHLEQIRKTKRKEGGREWGEGEKGEEDRGQEEWEEGEPREQEKDKGGKNALKLLLHLLIY